MSGAAYEASVRAVWAARDERLRDSHGWLSLAGLWWLHPGANSFGADPANEIVLHAAAVPSRAGVLELRDGEVRLEQADPLVIVDGLPATSMVLRDDAGEGPTMLAVGSLQVNLIRRGTRVGLRVRDPASPVLARFAGMEHYPIDPSWRVTARLEPATGEEVEIVDVIGDVSHERVAGILEFERDGRTVRLAALEGGSGTLWLIFADTTNGWETYGGGRYVHTEPVAADGRVVVDFNLAYNPPCVFSAYATCPLPPGVNRLPLPIEAGERAFNPA